MRPFSEAGKVAVTKMHSSGLSFFKIHRKTAILDFQRSSDFSAECSMVAKLVLSLTRLPFSLVRFGSWSTRRGFPWQFSIPSFHQFEKSLHFMDRLSFAFSATLDPGKKMPPGNMYAVSPIQLTYDAYGKRDAFGAPLAPVSVKFNVPGGFKTVPRSLWSAYVVLFVPFGGWGKGGGGWKMHNFSLPLCSSLLCLLDRVAEFCSFLRDVQRFLQRNKT